MNLITEFRDRDGKIIADFDDEGGEKAVLIGNRIEIFDDRGHQLGRAVMRLDYGELVWDVYRGRRGRKLLGVATDIRFSI